jgi:hypothetical protein
MVEQFCLNDIQKNVSKNGYQSLVGSVVIDSEPGRKDQCLTHTIAIERRFKPLDVRTDPNKWLIIISITRYTTNQE